MLTPFDIALAFFTVSSIYLNNSESSKERKIAPLLGLCAQPFWFYSSIKSGELGVLIVTIFITAGWLRGFYNQWIKRNNK